MKYQVSIFNDLTEFLNEIKDRTGYDLKECYQCGKCTAGCSTCFAMDKTPNQIIRMIQLGMRKEVLESKTIWLCASCETCTTRCPREIDVAKVMNTLRLIAQSCPEEVKISSEVSDVPLMSKIFLWTVKYTGRLYDFGLIALYNNLSGNFFKDMMKGPLMFKKGKLSILPHKVKNIKAIKRIFKRAEELSE
ncbi:MAG: 4Fe-4S dicluster domain-containing protein [bacterium]|nr:4Fe-4S dicluster domain-containing protein [bacterium]